MTDADAGVGLCLRCTESKVVESGRGSRFFLCKRAETDPRYRKYPELPVLACEGFSPPRDE